MHFTNNDRGQNPIQQGKPNTVEEANSSKSLNEEHNLSSPPDEKSSSDGHGSNTRQEESNDHQKDEKASD